MKKIFTTATRLQVRELHIPQGAIKITPKSLEIVFYLYNSNNKPCAMLFRGTASKPSWRYRFPNEKARDRQIAETIEVYSKSRAYSAQQKAEAAKPCKLEVGHILETSWGYDQTNVNFYRVIEARGARTIVVQEVEHISANTGNEAWLTGKSIPGEAFRKHSKPIVCRVSYGDRVKIERHIASIWDGKPASWTAYH